MTYLETTTITLAQTLGWLIATLLVLYIPRATRHLQREAAKARDTYWLHGHPISRREWDALDGDRRGGILGGGER